MTLALGVLLAQMLKARLEITMDRRSLQLNIDVYDAHSVICQRIGQPRFGKRGQSLLGLEMIEYAIDVMGNAIGFTSIGVKAAPNKSTFRGQERRVKIGLKGRFNKLHVIRVGELNNNTPGFIRCVWSCL